MTVSLAEYVEKRNGVPLGASRSMRNMLQRALGAKSFPVFWHYWNPIWGYYLSRHVLRPLSAVVPKWFAVLLTFLVSGALHDVAVSLVKWQTVLFFTPWFGMMGAMVIVSNKYAIAYGAFTWPIRALINLFLIGISLQLVLLLERCYF